MGEMICVKDLITGNQYESIRLASQMTKVPESKIRKFVDEGKPANYKGKVYLFKKVLYGDKSTKRGHFRRRFDTMPFGKYKGQKIDSIDDISYLSWIVELDSLDSTIKSNIRVSLKKRKENEKTSKK